MQACEPGASGRACGGEPVTVEVKQAERELGVFLVGEEGFKVLLEEALAREIAARRQPAELRSVARMLV